MSKSGKLSGVSKVMENGLGNEKSLSIV